MAGSDGSQLSAVEAPAADLPAPSAVPAALPRRRKTGVRDHLLITMVTVAGLIGWLLDGHAGSVLDAALGVGTAVVVYATCRRYDVWIWLAAAAAAPTAWTLGALGGSTSSTEQAIFGLAICAVMLAAVWSVGNGDAPRGLPASRIVAGLCAVLVPFMWWAGQASFADELTEQATPAALQSLLVAAMVLGLAATLGFGRADASGLRWACGLTTLAPIGVLWATTTNGHPQWHDPLVIALLPAAGALGLTAVLRGRRGPAVERSQFDDVDQIAIADFEQRYASPSMAPVAIVIAAYNEENGLPAVLATMPTSVCGLRTDVIVVDDKSTDATATVVAERTDAYLVTPQTNRGQGAALRLGYRIARDGGAQFIITTDADGQYDPADFPGVLGPIVADRADFVTGSRRRGQQETHDRFRRLGVHVFAWIVSAMTGQWTTDTSFGLRAMRAEITEQVTLNQPQYQASELLLGLFSHGYRVLEVPGRMRVRAAGSTKKGRNSVYGRRYAGVVFGTWWREGCLAPARDRAPALRPVVGVGRVVEADRPEVSRRRAWARRNRVFLVALGLGVVARCVVMLAYSPGFIHSDARTTYLPLMDELVPNQSRPVGYGVLIMRPVSWFTHDVYLVAAVQHLLGLATAVLIYAILRRWGVRPWVATLAALPLLFDAMQLLLEHTALSDVLFDFLVVAAIAVLAWRSDLDARFVFVAGLLLGTSVTVRLVAEPLIVVAVIFCLWMGHRWRTRLIAAGLVVAGFAIPVLAYATWYQQEHGVFALAEFTGKTMYLRSTSFVECSEIDVPDYQRVLCPTDPVGERHDPTWYVFSSQGNLQSLTLPDGVTEDQALREFARAAISAQPLDYLRTVGRDFMLNFKIERIDYDNYETAWKWTFVTYDEEGVRDLDAPLYPDHGGMLQAHQPWSEFLVHYEDYAYLAGPVLLGCLVFGVVGIFVPGRSGRRDLRPLTFLVVASATAMLIAPDVTAEFVWRYQLPAIALLPAGAALAYTSLRRAGDQPGAVATASTD